MDGEGLKRPQSLTDALIAFVRDEVISGRYVPGQQLTEANLAQALGTSRGTVRVAMRALADLGLVSLSGHRGAFVTTLTPSRAQEIYTLRAVLESFAARIAAEEGRLDAAAIAILEQRYQALTQAVEIGDERAAVEADIGFHNALSSMAGHQLLLEHLGAIQVHSRRLLIHSDMYRTDAVVVARRHLLVLDAIRAGDPREIERIVREHVAEVGRDIVEQLTAAAGLAGQDARAVGATAGSQGG